MADGSAATPGSSSSKPPATKDKACPYCHQHFTSSSLGRHLDLYIKEKNAKPPDDVHNVEEIKRTRGNVTRRQTRTSSGKREGSTPSSSKPTPFRDQRSPSLQRGYVTAGHANDERIRTFLNKATWHQTGVINDLPAMGDETPYIARLSPSRRVSTREEITRKQNTMEERDRARATELALQEVLESVKAANMRAHPTSPFDFNFFSLSFPQLCLKSLSAPPSLLARPPAAGLASWSIETPQSVYLDTLRDWLGKRLNDWRRQRQPQQGQSNGTNGHMQDRSDQEPQGEIEEKYYQHLSAAFDAWKALPEKQKQDRWREECAKAFAREQETHEETKRKLDFAEQEIQHLRSQLAQMHHSTDFSPYPPTVLPITRETAANLTDSPNWNFNALISKHRAQLQSHRSTQHPLPTPSPWSAPTPNMNSNNHTNGGSSYQYPRSGDQRTFHNEDHETQSIEDEDLADAPGDEDDMGNQNQPLDRGMLDPHLREDGIGEIDGEGAVGGRMLMGLREYDGTGGGGQG